MEAVSFVLPTIRLPIESQNLNQQVGRKNIALRKVSRPGHSCRVSLRNVPADQSTDTVGSNQTPNLDQEWVSLGLSCLADDEVSHPKDDRLTVDLATHSSGTPHSSSETLTHEKARNDLDHVWLDVGLTLATTDPALSDVIIVNPPILEQEPEGSPALDSLANATEPGPFDSDLRPVALFDGACNFCSKWVVFLLDHDPHGNLRFASMQGETGKALLRRAGLKEADTSEIVLASYNRSYIGAEAILHIFSRLNMPFPIIAAVGFMTPGAVTHSVYKLVSKYRHKFGGPSACRLFDPRFNERFIS